MKKGDSYVQITNKSLKDKDKQGDQYYYDKASGTYKKDYIQHDSGKYLKYSEESASDDQKNKQKYYYDEATDSYLGGYHNV